MAQMNLFSGLEERLRRRGWTRGEGRVERVARTYTHYRGGTGSQREAAVSQEEPSLVRSDDVRGGGGVEAGEILHTAGSRSCTAETNTL